MRDYQTDGLLSLELEMTFNQTQASSGDDSYHAARAFCFSPDDQVITYREAADQQEIPPVSKGEFESSMILGEYRRNQGPAQPETIPRL